MKAAAGATLALVLAIAIALLGSTARAHELRPTLLAIDEVAPEEYRVQVRRSWQATALETVTPLFPSGSVLLSGPERSQELGQAVESFRVRVPGGWEGKPVAVRATGVSGGEILVRAQTRAGRIFTGRLVIGRGDWVMPREAVRLEVAGTYVFLGLEHIFTGLDHLAFVLGLILLTPAWRQLWKSVTAFTAAHSLTLALAALGVVHVAQAPVEAVIALSILLVAREAALVARGRPGGQIGSPARRTWPLAFVFGLLHGLGFAGALAEVGMPAGDVPLALLAFNVGVELGQLSFVAAILGLWRALDRFAARAPARWRPVPAYAIGALAFYWCLERITRFWA